MKGQQAFGEVTHALMRKHNPYHPGYPGAHLCLAKSMAETNMPIGTWPPRPLLTWAHAEPLQSYPVIREASRRMDTLRLEM